MKKLPFVYGFLLTSVISINGELPDESSQASCSPECTPVQEPQIHYGTEPRECPGPRPEKCPPSPPATPLCCEPAMCGKSSYSQTEPLPAGCTSSYNIPSTVAVCSEYPFFLRGSFLYWYVGEEGLSLATNGVLDNYLYLPSEATSFFPTFEYKPGFKILAGYTIEKEWTVYAEYTWLRGSHSVQRSAASETSATAGTEGVAAGAPVWAVNDWFIQRTFNGQALAGSTISSTWEYSVDFLDASLSRPSYHGQFFVVAPYGGLRAAWIGQTMKVFLTESANQLLFPTPASPILSKNTSSSWAIGPRMGLDAACLLPMGFRIEGDLSASVLFTHYTTISHEEDPASSAFFNQNPLKIRWNGYNCVRPMTECSFGFGWGEYLQNEAYHIDFSADYSFSYLWGQNMIRKILDEALTGTAATASDMYFHGLTLTGRLDF